MMSQPHIARTVVVSLLALASVAGSTRAREQTVGLFTYEADASEGYTLFAPLQSTTTYLIDNQGLIVNTWESTHTPGASVYLNNNGTLLRMSNSGMGVPGSAGLVQAFDWDSNLLWSYQVPLSHHDLEQLPNGNLLIVVWEIKSLEECIQAGRYPSTIPDGELWPETIIEVHPTGPTTGEVVWEWHLWDHLVQELDPTKDNFGVVADHPELVNINFFTTQIADWIHINAVDYNAELDQILVTVPRFGEMWVIDHSTTSEEAAGHTGGDSGKGGDLIYRWGNPLAYNAGTVADWSLFFCHDGRWIDPGLPGEGNIMVFNNGLNRPEGDFSTVEEIVPPVDGNGYEHVPTTAYGPAAPTWLYVANPPEDFYSNFISGAHRLPNGNTLICEGKSGRIFEVTSAGEIVWQYVSPVTGDGSLTQGDAIPLMPNTPDPDTTANFMFRATRYPTDYPGFDGLDLTPSGTVEINTCPADTNFSGVVDVVDLITLLGDWGDCTGLCQGDVTRNGAVDVLDLIEMLQVWGECSAP